MTAAESAVSTLQRAISILRAAASAQWAIALMFWRNPMFRYPLVVVWVASIGGALHEPVVTFFYLKVGATEMDIGMLGLVKTIGTLVLAPL